MWPTLIFLARISVQLEENDRINQSYGSFPDQDFHFFKIA